MLSEWEKQMESQSGCDMGGRSRGSEATIYWRESASEARHSAVVQMGAYGF